MEIQKIKTEKSCISGNAAGSSKTVTKIVLERRLLQKVGLFFIAAENVLEIMSFYETIEIQLT